MVRQASEAIYGRGRASPGWTCCLGTVDVNRRAWCCAPIRIATRDNPLVLEVAGTRVEVWLEHDEHFGTVQWLIETEGATELLCLEAGPDDTEEDVRQIVEIWWHAKHN